MKNQRPRNVITAVCLAADVDLRDFLGTGRKPDVVRARWAYVWLCRSRTLAGYPEIARVAGRKNWGGCIDQYTKAADLLATDDAFAELVDKAERILDGRPPRAVFSDHDSEVYKALVAREAVR